MRSQWTTKSKFLEVVCEKCKNEQTIFSKASTHVKCLVCGATIAEATGGTVNVKGKINKTLD